jgi:MraZ protein
VFKGSYVHRIDAKGRLPVPAAFRRGLVQQGAGTVVVTPLDQCLAAYAPSEWTRLEDQLRTLPAFSRPVKALTRLLMSRAADCELDVQGRILLPAPLRAAAGLDREALVVGVLNRFEVWSPERWAAFLADSEKLLEDATLDVQWPLPPSPAREPPRTGHPQEKPRR